MYHYRQNTNDNEFELVDDDTGEVLWCGPEVAIHFDGADGTLLRHGDPTSVNEHYLKTITVYSNSEDELVQRIGRDQVYVCSDRWPVEELNKILDITGYVARAAQKLGLLDT